MPLPMMPVMNYLFPYWYAACDAFFVKTEHNATAFWVLLLLTEHNAI